ncbi:MAG: preprotein translocase subunit SecG [Chlamydiota bacterium]|nr:preprotein translocase subunit SecG [Chlamydiota bacterium]
MYALLIVVHLMCCLGLIVIVLLQAGKGGGLSGAFGASTVESTLGAGASDVLKKATTVMAVMFMLTSLGLAFISAQKSASVVKDTVKPSAPVPAQQGTPAQEGGILEGQSKETMQKLLKEITDKIPVSQSGSNQKVSDEASLETSENGPIEQPSQQQDTREAQPETSNAQ